MNFKQKRGQAISEYLILTALIAIGSISILQILSYNIKSRLSNVANAIGGHAQEKVDSKKAKEENYQVRDLGDFTESIQDNQ